MEKDYDQIGLLPEKLYRRFRVRTILIPVLFMALHWLMINLSAIVYLVIFVLIGRSGPVVDPWAVFADSDLLNRVLVEQYPIITIFYSIVLIPVYYIFLTISRQNDPRILWLEPLTLHHLFPSLAMIIGSLGLTNLWFSLLISLSESSSYVDNLLNEYLAQVEAFAPTAGYIWLILGIVIMAPIAEELLFRGIIQGELRKAMPEWLAIIIQAGLFALFHMQPIQISYVIIPGLLLGMAYAWSKTIWVPIIMHIVFNFFGSIIPALLEGDEVLGNIVVFSQIAFILVGGIATVYLYLRRRPSEQKNI